MESGKEFHAESLRSLVMPGGNCQKTRFGERERGYAQSVVTARES